MRIYLDYLQDILDHGTEHADRTGTGTLRVFGRQLRFDLTDGFPLLTTKRVWMRGVTEELLWFLRGETNIQPLVQAGVSIWTDWPLQRYREQTGAEISQDAFEERIATDDAFAEKWGDLGPIYGKQWRDFEGPDRRVDQIRQLVDGLRERPHSRRHVVSAWHPAQIEDAALPPCHYAFQCFVEGGDPDSPGRLSLMWQQRSVDSFLGLPFNIASYALLTHMLAQQTGLVPHELIFHGGDCHIYQNHLEQVQEQLSRAPYERPTLRLRPQDSLDAYTTDDVNIAGYEHHPALKAPIAV
ncbi:thymidylate synthase [Salinibacter sp. 10B]|uniref:thymidylate synthase n=1 Tax=Salinibacter sp. 10B TaxID=1923971 RepID=UPI000CF5255F|nr:thymidylate synthase [Salinibacter sp. 10B]PQJ33747.1 thymidylate synthase [Salinibacter sp. 10B]